MSNISKSILAKKNSRQFLQSAELEITIEYLTKLSVDLVKNHCGSDQVNIWMIADIVRLADAYQIYIQEHPTNYTLAKSDISKILGRKDESIKSSGLVKNPKTETGKLYNLIMPCQEMTGTDLPYSSEIQRLSQCQLTGRYLMPHLVADTLMISNIMVYLQGQNIKPTDMVALFTQVLGILSKDLERFKMDHATMLSCLQIGGLPSPFKPPARGDAPKI